MYDLQTLIAREAALRSAAIGSTANNGRTNSNNGGDNEASGEGNEQPEAYAITFPCPECVRTNPPLINELETNQEAVVEYYGEFSEPPLGNVCLVCVLPPIRGLRFLGLGAAATRTATSVSVGEYTLSRTVAGHIGDVVRSGAYAGQAARPFLTSPLTIQEITAVGRPIAEASGALRYTAPGTFRGSSGNWQLVINPETNTIFHFNFVTP